jgi:uncharacterized lipoprotein YehR (DUF1307 family)
MKAMQLLVLAGATLGFAVVGCEQKNNPVTNAANSATNAVKDTAKAAGDAVAKTADATKDTAAKAVDATKDATKAATDTVKDAGTKAVEGVKDAAAGAADAAKGAADKLMAEGKTWLSDTVTKQWPGMKAQLDTAAKAIPGIKDAGVKTKAEGLLKDLQGQIPAIEKLVTDLPKETDLTKYTSMFDQAKKAWDGFGGKLKELTGMLPK